MNNRARFQTKVKKMGYIRGGLMALYVSIYSIISVMLLSITKANENFMNCCTATMIVGIICVIFCIIVVIAETRWLMSVSKAEIPNGSKIKWERRMIIVWMGMVAILYYLEKTRLSPIDEIIEHEFTTTFVLGLLCGIMIYICHHIRERVYYTKQKESNTGYWI